MQENTSTLVHDQEDILKVLKTIDLHDAKTHMLLTQDSMNQLFNNFVYFKDFLVHSFSKQKMLKLCIEFLNQIYPQENLPIMQMKSSEAHEDTNSTTENAATTENSSEENNETNTPTTTTTPTPEVSTSTEQATAAKETTSTTEEKSGESTQEVETPHEESSEGDGSE